MKEIRTFNVYCDESCHLEYDHIPVMAWGGTSCATRFVRELSERTRFNRHSCFTLRVLCDSWISN